MEFMHSIKYNNNIENTGKRYEGPKKGRNVERKGLLDEKSDGQEKNGEQKEAEQAYMGEQMELCVSFACNSVFRIVLLRADGRRGDRV